MIKNKKQHKEALKEIQSLMAINPNPKSKKGKRLNILVELVEEYEDKIFPKYQPTKKEAEEFRKEQESGIKKGDIVYIEQAWEDEAGQYHDEYAKVKKINLDGTMKLKWLDVKSRRTKRFLNLSEFFANDYEAC